jgi:hypothetical protein
MLTLGVGETAVEMLDEEQGEAGNVSAKRRLVLSHHVEKMRKLLDDDDSLVD